MHAPLMDDNNWDLFAVVRAASSFAISDSLSNSKEEDVRVSKDDDDDDLFSFCELQDLCKPIEFHRQAWKQQQLPLLSDRQQSRRAQRLTPQTLRPKLRKNQQKKKVTCQVPADGAQPDLWAWRKYGQKPIKGSPYPRGYYRCSSSKACEAKKQVERSRADPETLLITYTAEHDHPVPAHRNSLAGTARRKQICPSTILPSREPASGRDMHFLDESGNFDDHFYHSTAPTFFDPPAPADGHSWSSVT